MSRLGLRMASYEIPKFPNRRNILGAAVAGAMLGLHKSSIALPEAGAKLMDALERPSRPVRIVTASPMLRVTRYGQRLISVGERGVVLLSDDDGLRWQQAQVPVSVSLTGVQFTSAQRGFVIGHSGVILRTDDAGQNWKRVFDGRQLHTLLSQPDAINQAKLDGPDKPWLAMHFNDDQNGMVVGAFGMALETFDGGQTWRSFADRLTNPRAQHLYAIHRREQSVWIAGEQGFYALSIDGGRHFSVLSTPYRGSYFALLALEDGRVLLGGLRGTLIQHNGGSEFRTLIAASTQSVIQLSRLDAQMLTLLDQSGRIYTANLADLSFKSIATLPTRSLSSIVKTSDGNYVGASFDGVFRLKQNLS